MGCGNASRQSSPSTAQGAYSAHWVAKGGEPGGGRGGAGGGGRVLTFLHSKAGAIAPATATMKSLQGSEEVRPLNATAVFGIA